MNKEYITPITLIKNLVRVSVGQERARDTLDRDILVQVRDILEGDTLVQDRLAQDLLTQDILIQDIVAQDIPIPATVQDTALILVQDTTNHRILLRERDIILDFDLVNGFIMRI